MSHQCEQSNKSAVSDYKPLLIVSSQPYPTLYTTPMQPYLGGVCLLVEGRG